MGNIIYTVNEFLINCNFLCYGRRESMYLFTYVCIFQTASIFRSNFRENNIVNFIASLFKRISPTPTYRLSIILSHHELNK